MGIRENANMFNHAVATRELQKQRQLMERQAAGLAGDNMNDSLLLEIIDGQRKTNRMLWAMLSDEQRASLEPL